MNHGTDGKHMGMRYLVTGCAGFIGSTLTDTLLAAGHEVVGVDCFTDYYERSRKEHNLEQARQYDGFSLHELDLASDRLEDVSDGVDGVFHLAAQAGVRASWGSEFDTYTCCNILATQRLLETLSTRNESRPRVVYASSSSIYGNALRRPTHESATPAPVSPYGVTKLAAEHLCSTYHHNHGIPVASLRFFTVYGERQRPDMAFHRFIRSALAGEQIVVFGDGHQSRDFTYVGDIVSGCLAAMRSTINAATYNLGGGSTVTVRETLDLLSDILDADVDVRYTDAQLGDVRHTSADTTSAHTEIGFTTSVTLAEGLAREVRWMRDEFL